MLQISHVKFFGGLSAIILLTLILRAPLRAQNDAPIAFTLLGPDGVVARVITPDAQCPEITLDGNRRAMQVRAAPDEKFPVTVCDAAIPASVQDARVGAQKLKLPQAKPERIVVIGDTGCRLKGGSMQACNDPAQWPFAQIADRAAQENPALVIHVGDYHYREAPCDANLANCAGSPYGDNWAAWNADFFTPGQKLIRAAPWAVVRGNHENCARAGSGYFRLLDPRPLPTTCPDYTEPYAIAYMEPQLLVMDNSIANDYEIEPAQVDAFRAQFEKINADAARAPSWLLLHDPLYAFGSAGVKDSQEQLFQDQLALQQASNNTFPATLQTFVSGHLHVFETVSFGNGRPPQLLVGNSGTRLDAPMQTPLQGLTSAGMTIQEGVNLAQFGYAALFRSGDHWAIGVRDVQGNDLTKCLLGDGKLTCGLNALPATGGAFTQNTMWLGIALLGLGSVVVGLALQLRAKSLRSE